MCMTTLSTHAWCACLVSVDVRKWCYMLFQGTQVQFSESMTGPSQPHAVLVLGNLVLYFEQNHSTLYSSQIHSLFSSHLTLFPLHMFLKLIPKSNGCHSQILGRMVFHLTVANLLGTIPSKNIFLSLVLSIANSVFALEELSSPLSPLCCVVV